MEKRKDLRVQKTHDAILAAFKAMICEMDANKITVKSLTERARIHRQTFYLHYSSLEDLYDEIFSETLAKFRASAANMEPPFDMRDYHRRFFIQCSQLEKYEERILCSPSYYFYGKRLLQAGLMQSQSQYNPYEQWAPEVQEMIRRFLFVNLLDFYRQWVMSGKKMSLEELTVLSSKLMFNGLTEFIDPVPNPAGGI